MVRRKKGRSAGTERPLVKSSGEGGNLSYMLGGV
jgi:hypothetical protein